MSSNQNRFILIFRNRNQFLIKILCSFQNLTNTFSPFRRNIGKWIFKKIRKIWGWNLVIVPTATKSFPFPKCNFLNPFIRKQRHLFSFAHSFAVSTARFKGLDITRSKEISLIPSPVIFARRIPFSFNSISALPCKRPCVFQTVSPCRMIYNFIIFSFQNKLSGKYSLLSQLNSQAFQSVQDLLHCTGYFCLFRVFFLWNGR